MERRQKMRLRLIESAFIVFARKGVDVSVIDDVIAEAQVSRGTFYNYFQTNTELMTAVSQTLSNELVSLIEDIVGGREDPVEILATGLRLFLNTASAYPQFASFVWRAGFNGVAAGHLIHTYLPRHIGRSMERGAFVIADVATGLEVIAGIMLAAVFSISTRAPGAGYPERIVQHILQALGVASDDAARLSNLPLPAIALPEQSLLVKAHH
jgi:AcrR family transcriptional regulator